MNKNEGNIISKLLISIIIIIILIGIFLIVGIKEVEKDRLEELKTNLLLIQAKAREYVEETDFKINSDETKIDEFKHEIYVEKAKLQSSQTANIQLPNGLDISDYYVLDKNTFQEWGLAKIKTDDSEYYLVKFDEDNLTVEVYNTKGYDGKYSLTDIDQLK